MGDQPMVYDPAATSCTLCGDTGAVDVIPHEMGHNDSREDECPWCLRRKMGEIEALHRALGESCEAELVRTQDLVGTLRDQRNTAEDALRAAGFTLVGGEWQR